MPSGQAAMVGHAIVDGFISCHGFPETDARDAARQAKEWVQQRDPAADSRVEPGTSESAEK